MVSDVNACTVYMSIATHDRTITDANTGTLDNGTSIYFCMAVNDDGIIVWPEATHEYLGSPEDNGVFANPYQRVHKRSIRNPPSKYLLGALLAEVHMPMGGYMPVAKVKGNYLRLFESSDRQSKPLSETEKSPWSGRQPPQH